MKRKVEKYLYSKNIDGVHRLKDNNDRYLIGDDIDGCLRAARHGLGSHLKNTSSSKKRKAKQLSSLFSPAVAPQGKTSGGGGRTRTGRAPGGNKSGEVSDEVSDKGRQEGRGRTAAEGAADALQQPVAAAAHAHAVTSTATGNLGARTAPLAPLSPVGTSLEDRMQKQIDTLKGENDYLKGHIRKSNQKFLHNSCTTVASKQPAVKARQSKKVAPSSARVLCWQSSKEVAPSSARVLTVLTVSPGKLGLTLSVLPNGDGAKIIAINPACSFKGIVELGDRIVTIDGNRVEKLEDLTVGGEKRRKFVIAKAAWRLARCSKHWQSVVSS